VIVIPDETCVDLEREDWAGAGRNLRFARIEVPAAGAVRRYRLMATIAMVEIDRQVGARAPGPAQIRPRPFAYDHGLGQAGVQEAGELVQFAELMSY
jgi:hypothetical protein